MRKIESGKFRKWLKKLKDETGRARIIARINRLMEGLAGDTYVILLCGGDKSTQRRDIEAAHQILKAWREQHG